MSENNIRQALEAHFNRILETHMAGMPVVNPELRVEAREFRHYENHTLCVMITPWFMSLFLFPDDPSLATEWKTGTTHQQTFPSGVYEFTAAQDEELGPYQSCALFSPMFDFSSHEMAQEAASASITALMDKTAAADEDQENARQIDQLWHEPTQPPEQSKNVEPEKISRRDLFRRMMQRGENG